MEASKEEQRGVVRFLVAEGVAPRLKVKTSGILSDGINLLHDNARPYTANLVKNKLQRFRWETLRHPLYQWRTVGSRFGEATMWWGVVLNVCVYVCIYIYIYLFIYLYIINTQIIICTTKALVDIFLSANLSISSLYYVGWLCSFSRIPFSIDIQVSARAVLVSWNS